jgi:aquaporin related protein
VTGALFNPAITLALWLIGGLTLFRAILLVAAQILGGIAAAALVSGLTPYGGTEMLINMLSDDTSIVQGLFIEAFLTSTLVLTVLLLAAEKHKSTFLAPIGIGLVLLSCHLFAIPWTGCGMNPARAFGPSSIAGAFPEYHWIYWLGPTLGSLMAVSFYLLLKVRQFA